MITKRELQALIRYELVIKARNGCYKSFVHLIHADPNDPTKSTYDFQPVHLRMIEEIQQVLDGETKYLILTTPPRIGKTEICARMLMPYSLGLKKDAENIYGSYGQGLSSEIATDIKNIMLSAQYAQIFPKRRIQTASDKALRMDEGRGRAVFAGRGTALTGKGVGFGGVLVLDDLFKDAEEADSIVIRDKAWHWMTKVAMTRRITDTVPMILVFTRWSEDDCIGRILNTDSLHYNEELAKQFKYVNMPAESKGADIDPLGRPEGESIWPSRFSLDYFHDFKKADPRGYSALYMGDPSPVDGIYFKAEDIHLYTDNQRPDILDLQVFGASDFAIAENQTADYTVHLVYGVDRDQNIWVLDMWRKRANAEKIINAWVDMADKWGTQLWYAEKGHISKSLAPFLRKRMQEENVFFAVRSIQPTQDKASRARSIQGRFNQGFVRLPASSVWVEDMRKELLGFQAGAAHDDIVDAFSLCGLGLDSTHGATKTRKAPAKEKEYVDAETGEKKVFSFTRQKNYGRMNITFAEMKARTLRDEKNKVVALNRKKF